MTVREKVNDVYQDLTTKESGTVIVIQNFFYGKLEKCLQKFLTDINKNKVHETLGITAVELHSILKAREFQNFEEKLQNIYNKMIAKVVDIAELKKEVEDVVNLIAKFLESNILQFQEQVQEEQIKFEELKQFVKNAKLDDVEYKEVCNVMEKIEIIVKSNKQILENISTEN